MPPIIILADYLLNPIDHWLSLQSLAVNPENRRQNDAMRQETPTVANGITMTQKIWTFKHLLGRD